MCKRFNCIIHFARQIILYFSVILMSTRVGILLGQFKKTNDLFQQSKTNLF